MELLYSDKDGQPYVREDMELATADHIYFIGKDCRQTDTGPHAWVGILLNAKSLGYDTFNITRDRDRVHLTNQTYKQLTAPQRSAISGTEFKRYFDLFCNRLWDVWQGQLRSEELKGDLSIRPAEFVLKPYLVEGGGTILYGAPGRGKSYLCMVMAVSAANLADLAQDYLLWPLKQMTPTYINLERSRASMIARLARVNMALGLAPETPLRFLHARGRQLKDIAEATRHDIQEHGVNLVILDSISRSGQGDLNENKTANSIIDMLNGLNITWVALGHTPRDNGEHAYGSVFFEAGADVMVGLKSTHEPGKDLGMTLEITKANDLPVFPPEYLGMQFDDEGLTAVYKARDTEFPELAAQRKDSFEESVLNYVRETGKVTASQVAQALRLDRSVISRFLKASDQISDLGKASNGERLYGSLSYF